MTSVSGEGQQQQLSGYLQEFAQVPAGQQPGLANLQQLTQEVMDKGYVTTADIEFLKNQANIIAPGLSAPKQALLTDFITMLNTISVGSGGTARLPIGTGKNAFLNCSAILALFIMTSQIIGILSQIQLAENLYKAKLSLVIKDMANAAYKAGIEAGKIEATKELAQAAKAAVDAGLAIGQIFISISMAVVTQIQSKRVEMDMRTADKTMGTRSLTASERIGITSQVDQLMKPMQGSLDGIVSTLRSTAEAAMHNELAKADVESAIQRASADLLNKLSDIVSQSVSMLSKSADDQGKAMDAIKGLFETAVRTYGEIGARG
jgi:hypothetical protein